MDSASLLEWLLNGSGYWGALSQYSTLLIRQPAGASPGRQHCL